MQFVVSVHFSFPNVMLGGIKVLDSPWLKYLSEWRPFKFFFDWNDLHGLKSTVNLLLNPLCCAPLLHNCILSQSVIGTAYDMGSFLI